MFSLLSAYLYQEKKLSIPGIGHFELTPKNATTSFETVEAPGWDIRFTENKSVTADNNPLSFYEFLAAKEGISKTDAQQQFEEFARNILVKLNDHEAVEWEHIGTLEKPDFRIAFTQKPGATALFTSIAAQKIIRENTSHQVLIGEKETSSGAIREQLQERELKQHSSRKIVWIVLAAAAGIAAIFLLKNGCSLQSSGNQQKAAIQKPAATYQLK